MLRGILLVVFAIVGLSGVPSSPLAASPDPARFIFVASMLDPTVAVIDSATDAVVSRARLPGMPKQIAALNKGAELVASDAGARRLYVIDAVSGSVKRELDTGIAPIVLQVDRTGTLFAIADPDAGVVELMRPAGGPVLRIPNLAGLRSMAFAPDGRLLVARGTRLALVDTATGRITADLAADGRDGPIVQVATDPGGEYAFAVHDDRGVLTVFPLKDPAKAMRVQLPPPVGRLLPSADSQFVMIPVAAGQAVSLISTWTLKESARIPMSDHVSGLGLGLFQSVSIGLSRAARTVQTIDLRDRRRLAPLSVPGVPEAGAPSPDGLKFYVALSDTGRVAVIDVLNASVSRVIDDVVGGASAVVSAVGAAYCH
ncbi:YncE family protein [Azospirillum sp.]|uniref:YncE family protein n=1 Tax=Azospirillum sp. TaxID=34012 RepID=UPI003D74E648